MKQMKAVALSALALALSADAYALDPLTTRWTLGAHEPYSMYRRMGKKATGGIEGSAQWVKDWLDALRVCPHPYTSSQPSLLKKWRANANVKLCYNTFP